MTGDAPGTRSSAPGAEERDGSATRWIRALLLGVGTGVVVGWLAVYGERLWVGVAAGAAVGAVVGLLAGLTETVVARRRGG